ncbi:hypothetical protein CAP36_06880 [Chitinophagaceae bacterium IBVUCB2]|nr:hypothetical protein CAP36_06880 [Chitinophagaceae bacterium IBVUCB2]
MVFTSGFFVDATQDYLVCKSIFSKQAVKTYPQPKIKLCGIAFERLDGPIFSHDINAYPPQSSRQLAVMKTKNT